MTDSKLSTLVLLLFLCLSANSTDAQTQNLLQNPNADFGADHWRAFGHAIVEEEVYGNRVFIVRNGGYFLQDAILPEGSVGKFAVLIGRGSSERINPDGAITDLPYLHGYMMTPNTPNGGNILAHLQGQQMLGAATFFGQWVKMWGIFEVPEGTTTIRFFLNQALRQGVPHNGSAARFDNLGLYLFPTEEEAKSFVASSFASKVRFRPSLEGFLRV